MGNKNLKLVFFALVAVIVFTLVAYFILIQWGILAGIVVFFILLLSVIVYLLQSMIIQMYDLLASPPTPGKTINPFQIIAFGKVLWHYPKGGSFTFLEHEMVNLSELPGKAEVDNNYEIPVNLLRRSKTGPKPRFTEEEYFHYVEQWYMES